jgi:hypothetical protein
VGGEMDVVKLTLRMATAMCAESWTTANHSTQLMPESLSFTLNTSREKLRSRCLTEFNLNVKNHTDFIYCTDTIILSASNGSLTRKLWATILYEISVSQCSAHLILLDLSVLTI